MTVTSLYFVMDALF